jgi:IS5 family transposase
LAPAVRRSANAPDAHHARFTADRGYGEKSVVDDLHDLGVRDVVIPDKGEPLAANNIGRRSDETFHGAPGA